MKKAFDYKQFWIDRLKATKQNLTGVGHRRFSGKANRLMYVKAEEALSSIVGEHALSFKAKTVLDAGAGIGMFCSFYLRKGAKVTAIDISDDAIKILKKKYPSVDARVMNLEEASRLRKQFDIVHCFDVLYHVVDEDKWRKTVTNLAMLSKNFFVIHDKYPYFGYQLFERGHVRVRSPEAMRRLLATQGFEEKVSFPSHLLFVHPILNILVNHFPSMFYRLDKMMITKGFTFMQTNYVRIFVRKRG